MNCTSVQNRAQSSLYGLDLIGNKFSGLDKASKIIYKTIDLINVHTGTVWKPFLELSTRLKLSIELFEAVQFFDSIKSLIFLETKSWQRVAFHVTLVVHHVLKFVEGLRKYGLIDLGRIGTEKIGELAIFRGTADAFIVIASVFATWDAINDMLKSNKELERIEAKITKWKNRSTELVDASKREALKAHYEQKMQGASEAKLEEYRGRIAKLDVGNYSDLVKERGQIWDAKLHNIKIDRTSLALKVCTNGGRIFVVGLALTLIALNYWVVVSRTILLGLGLFSDSTGLAKTLYDAFPPLKQGVPAN